jgi:hypothetical protein
MSEPENLEKLPWDYPGMVVCPGRYYLTVYYLEIPAAKEFPMGGNLCGLVWRFAEEAAYRHRYYFEKEVWGNKDKRSWYVVRLRGTEPEVESQTEQLFELIKGMAKSYFSSETPSLERLVIKGDDDAFARVYEEQKPSWMDRQIILSA